ncbi:NUDIX domain-containing protein [Paenarthrobacter ureafaciens]|uniref:NUDIX domain-containing protein n=1 Tax=Paenarthrobacter ureafaciens TaxID=37931 RepID=UPI002DB8DD33|nr:NUDIX domain-containing protein [Paenarthrobacter ureafaciens]MEC3853672.1 NUDIX domain-containing protein [Paenarthrobacter ureafaciens]
MEMCPGIPRSRTVVAVILEWRGKIALFRRSHLLSHDQGLWHCITGYVEENTPAHQQAIDELFEETGLRTEDLHSLRKGPDLVINDIQNQAWRIHTYVAHTKNRRLRIDWEHDTYRWTSPNKTKRFTNRVPWLDTILQANGFAGANAGSWTTERTAGSRQMVARRINCSD